MLVLVNGIVPKDDTLPGARGSMWADVARHDETLRLRA
jgi:hypothetical protein